MKDTGIVIQARSGSTRLSNKMTRPFYKDKTVLDILLNRLTISDLDIPIVVATTKNRNDNMIESICTNNKVEVFRGDENNVLSRFVTVADMFSFKKLIRICADNPFFDVEGTTELLRNNNADYVSYMIDGDVPSIKSHLGFWGEVVSTAALLKVSSLTTDSLYLEHVTNYIYTHPDKFECTFVHAQENLFNRSDIRLTMDTLEDFKLYQRIYSEIVGESNVLNIDDLIEFIDSNSEIRKVMKQQIIQNTK